MSEDKFLSDYSPVMRLGILSARLPIPWAVSIRLPLNSSHTRNVWPPVAVYYVSAGLPSLKPEKRA